VYVGLDLRRSRRLLFALALTALALVIAAGASVTSASAATTKKAVTKKTTTPPSSQPTAVGQGVTASQVPGVTVFGTTDPSTPETVSFILSIQNEGFLSAQVEHGMNRFLSVSQFANQYGQSRSYIGQLTSYLAHYGISTNVYGDDLDVVASGTAGQFDSALSTSQNNYSAPAINGRGGQLGHPAQHFHGATHSPYLPRYLANGVTAILGLTNYAPFVDSSAKMKAGVSKPNSSSSNACVQLTGLTSACHLPQDFAKSYGLSPLSQHGAQGQGQTIGIVTLAALDQGAPEYFWKNVEGLPAASANRAVKVENIDGGPGDPSFDAGSSETDLDVEQSGGLAPAANVTVYQAPNTDSGFADAFFTAATENAASSVSASWGESETIVQAAVAQGVETPAYEAAFDEAFLEFAAQGQSGFLSSGDQGAYDAINDLGTTNLAVDTSADSPYITSAGGTTLPYSATFTSRTDPTVTASFTVPAERIWGWDYLWQAADKVDGIPLLEEVEEDIAGGGGGFSTTEPEPSYQRGVPGTGSYAAVQYLNPIDYTDVGGGLYEPTDWSLNPTPGVKGGWGSGRAEPDLAADADPETGYLEYSPSFADADAPGPVLEGGWGGTSFVAPQLNGSAAVIDSALGRRVGLWNPTMYRAATSWRSPFTPLNTQGTSNDNLYYTGTPGTLYNQGAGLGTPNLAALASDF
jgi:kumamolisin